MKRLSVELRYPGRTVQEVRAMLADPAFRRAVCDYQAVEDSEVVVEEYEDGSMTVDTDRTYGADFVPSFARKFVGASIEIVQREEWTSTDAVFEIRTPGKPGEMNGRARLTQSGPDVVETIDGEVKVSIPLVGGRLEDMISNVLESGFRAENKVGIKWLAGEWRV